MKFSPHVRVCITLLLLAIPIAIADALLLTKGGGSGWISLNLSGLLIGAYLFFLTAHFVVSTIAVSLFPKQTIGVIHLLSAMTTVLLFSVGTAGYFAVEDKISRDQYQEDRAARKLMVNVITLDHWSFSPNTDSATALAISVTVSESGRFAAGANGRSKGEYGEWYFTSENEQQRMVAKGEHFDFHIPLRRDKAGIPANIEITLYLFADSTGSAKRDVIKVFQSDSLITEDDGEYFYGLLPQPDAPR